jgi:hypothetical protein
MIDLHKIVKKSLGSKSYVGVGGGKNFRAFLPPSFFAIKFARKARRA